jgi:hypothetical protein
LPVSLPIWLSRSSVIAACISTSRQTVLSVGTRDISGVSWPSVIAALYGAISLLYITAHFILSINAWIVAGRSGPIASGKPLVSIHENTTLNPARLKENAARSLT